MTATLQEIVHELRPLKLDDSLLFLCHLLAVSRKEVRNPVLEHYLSTSPAMAPTFACHFIAKQIILNSSPVGPNTLNLTLFQRLLHLYFELVDPIASGPGWKDADPTGFFERFLGPQIASQNHLPLREMGLVLALFRDTDANIRNDLEREIGMSIEQFMEFGFICRAAHAASIAAHNCPGTITFNYLTEAYSRGFKIAVPDIWRPALERIACTPALFRDVCQRPEYRLADDMYASSEFNPLHRYPLIEVSDGHFVAPDAELLVSRTTWGLFYDLFERDRSQFTDRFGAVFERLVGQLLLSVCSTDSIWSAEVFEQATTPSNKPKSRLCDWAYRGNKRIVLIECKSLRPTLELTTKGSEASVEKAAGRIADALEQLADHDTSIQRGEWQQHGILPGPTIHVVLTYGRITTINGPFFRNRIKHTMSKRGRTVAPYVVLSLLEFDAVIRLMEMGEQFDDVMVRFSGVESFDVTQLYQPQLATMSISNYTLCKGKAFLDQIVPE